MFMSPSMIHPQHPHSLYPLKPPLTLHLVHKQTHQCHLISCSSMASQSSSLALALVLLIMIIAPQAQAQIALAPSPPGPINVTAILEKGGQYQTLIRLLTATQVASQIDNTLNSSDIGLTMLAPTDNAFNNLKPGTLNGLTTQEQVELILYHVLPKYYSIVMFETVSNPVRTQAGSQDGGQIGLNFTTSGNNQVNVSSGIVTTQLNTALRQEFPLAVYSIDKVLLPLDLFGPKTPKASPPAASKVPSKNSPPTVAGEPSGSANNTSGSDRRSLGMGLVAGIGFLCMSVLSL